MVRLIALVVFFRSFCLVKADRPARKIARRAVFDWFTAAIRFNILYCKLFIYAKVCSLNFQKTETSSYIIIGNQTDDSFLLSIGITKRRCCTAEAVGYVSDNNVGLVYHPLVTARNSIL